LPIYTTRALHHKYFVDEYVFCLSESPPSTSLLWLLYFHVNRQSSGLQDALKALRQIYSCEFYKQPMSHYFSDLNQKLSGE